MPIIQVTDEQVADLVRQLSPNRQVNALLAHAGDAATREQRLNDVETRLRQLCLSRGQDWDKLSEEQRELLIDDLVHEDRSCQP
jgi:hypothetical protein